MNIIENRKEVINYINKDLLYTFEPIIINGDLYGGIIVYDDKQINDKELEIIRFSKLFLENYLE